MTNNINIKNYDLIWRDLKKYLPDNWRGLRRNLGADQNERSGLTVKRCKRCKNVNNKGNEDYRLV